MDKEDEEKGRSKSPKRNTKRVKREEDFGDESVAHGILDGHKVHRILSESGVFSTYIFQIGGRVSTYILQTDAKYIFDVQ